MCSRFAELEKAGYTVKRGKYLAVRAEGQERFVRTKTLHSKIVLYRVRQFAAVLFGRFPVCLDKLADFVNSLVVNAVKLSGQIKNPVR